MMQTACVLLATLLGAAANAQSPARVERFSPQGTVKQLRQVTARFTVPMVSMGDPRLSDPFDIRCSAEGKGRWADVRVWVYDFHEDVPAGVRCSFTLKKGLRAADGAALMGQQQYAFDTGGPAIQASLPQDGSEALDEEQVFLLRLDAPATDSSVQQHAYCVVEGLAERVPLHVLTGDARRKVLDQRKALGYSYYESLWQGSHTSSARVRGRALESHEALITVAQCRRRLPPATQVQLVWGAGIAAGSGIATTQAQKLSFKVRPAFTARVECTRTEPTAGCTPIDPITIRFSAPVPRDQALRVRLRERVADEHARERMPDSSAGKQVQTLDELVFKAPFPASSAVTAVLPENLTDDAGRALQNAARFPLEVRIDEFPPLVKFSADFGILEANEGGVLPVTLRNVEPGGGAGGLRGRRLRAPADAASIAGWLQRVRKATERSGELRHDDREQRSIWQESTGARSVFGSTDPAVGFNLDTAHGGKPMEVVGIPLVQPGLHVVEIESRRLGAALLGPAATHYVATAALVTNLVVHFKWGRESSRVWVTQLDNGTPVANADVIVVDFCNGNTRWRGKTGPDGVAAIDESLGAPHEGDTCDKWSPAPLIVTAKLGADMSFALSSWLRGIAPHEFGLQMGGEWDLDIFHTVLDRPLYRAGEAVSMKHFVRRHRGAGIATPPDVSGTYKVVVTHLGSDQRYEAKIRFGADGVAEQIWHAPSEARLGDYEIAIEDGGKRLVRSGQFKVQEFRLPTLHAAIHVPTRPLVRPREVTIDLQVNYLSGGGASGLPIKVRSMIEPLPARHAGYEDFNFGGAPVKEGITELGAARWDFEGEENAAPGANKAQLLPATLDAQGAARLTIPIAATIDSPAQWTAELEYPDANGELLTAVSRVRLVPAELSVGIRSDSWVASPEQMRFRVAVLGLDGQPAKQTKAAVSLYQAQSYSYRKRLIGGFYAYETLREIKKLVPRCEGETNAQGLLLCELAPGASGEILVRAEARDARGRMAGATTSVWIAGQDEWWFGGTVGDRMDLLPEKKEYQAGETARFQVRMPFRSAMALVTVEREGVLKSFVTRLSGRAPVVEVPLADAYAPNVYVSVLAVRGRVGARKIFRRVDDSKEITALVDLNKPAYRLGNAEIRIGWAPHRLNVRVAPDLASYGVREKANIAVEVTRADGKPLPPNAEIALAAVDESLLELAPNASWNLLDAMMGKRGLEVWTSTAQMQVVGKRHYGRKAAPHGGGGGRERARETFDTLLLWRGRVPLDMHGKAEAVIPLNDSLTSFRIVAIAHAGSHLFGTGSANIVTTQDLMLLSGLPPLVREGDRFAATFTVRNTTRRALPVTVVAEPNIPLPAPLPARTLEIPAGEARDVVWDLEVPAGAQSVAWQITARQVQGGAHDSLKVQQVVRPAIPVRTYQASLSQLVGPMKLPVMPPKRALAGRGGIEVTLQEKLTDGLQGVRSYMSRYPYSCLEQSLSRAIALRDLKLWEGSMARLPAYMDREGLLRFFPSEALPGEDTLTAYVLAISAEAGWKIPETQRQRLIDALTRFVQGRIVRESPLPTADLTIRKLAAIDALARHGAAAPEMLDSLTIDPNLWPTSAVLDWLGILRRVRGIQQAAAKQKAAEGILRSRLNFQGTTMGFSTQRSDALWWLMISADSNAVRALLEVVDKPSWREDVPRLVRGAIGRQKNGHWNTTVANAWGTLAMEKFSAAFESSPVTGSTSIRYDTSAQSITWPLPDAAKTVELPWREASGTLAVNHAGTGKPWITVRAAAALPLEAPLSTGFSVRRSITAVEQQEVGKWTRGDVARVRLELEAQSEMSWVVVEDPVPAGAALLGGGLNTQSQLLVDDERQEGGVWPAYEERRFESFRAYYRYVPKGAWAIEYTVRLNNPGTFELPPTRVEAMYAPEMLGEAPNAPIVIGQRP